MIPTVHLAPVMPAWAVIAAACHRALRRSRGPQKRHPSALETILAVTGMLAAR